MTALTAYGCDRDEAELFETLALRYGVRATITDCALTEADVGLAVGSRCVSVGHKAEITRATLLALRDVGVEYLSTRSIGFNHLDLEFARAIGLTVGNVAYSPDSVADFTLMAMLMLLRDARGIVCRAGRHDYRLSEVRGRELRDLGVGVVGTGRIGTAVLERLRGFGCRVLACDSRATAEATYVSLDELLRHSDLVTLHVPLDPSTHHLLDRRRLDRMKRGALVVNTGRGPLIDTAALLTALEQGRLGGAALDVVEGEEGVFYSDCSGRSAGAWLHRLQALPQVLITPHTAYYTDHALTDAVENSLVNCLDYERGRRWTG